MNVLIPLIVDGVEMEDVYLVILKELNALVIVLIIGSFKIKLNALEKLTQELSAMLHLKPLN
jgi:hypothetical protein